MSKTTTMQAVENKYHQRDSTTWEKNR